MTKYQCARSNIMRNCAISKGDKISSVIEGLYQTNDQQYVNLKRESIHTENNGKYKINAASH
jgi:hypothetical protein